MHCPFSAPIMRSPQSFYCGRCGVMNARSKPEQGFSAAKWRRVEARRLPKRGWHSVIARPSLQNRLIRACSSALAAVGTLPGRDRRQPGSFRL